MTNYKCRACGNNELFNREDTITRRVYERGTITNILDNEGCVYDDAGDFDPDICDVDEEWTDDCGEVICSKCDSTDIIDLDDEEEVPNQRELLKQRLMED